jgi:hypothetical protein
MEPIRIEPGHWQHLGSIGGLAAALYFGNHGVTWADTVMSLCVFTITTAFGVGLEARITERYLTKCKIQRRAGEGDNSELESMIEGRARAMAQDHPVTLATGNTPVFVPVAENVTRKQIHPAMEAYKFETTLPALDGTHVRLGLMKFCKQQWTWLDHPELGYPEGDYREKTWVETGRLSRRELNVYKGILEHNHAIARKGSARNATHVTTDPAIIREGAWGTPLPHPNTCECDDCAVT